MSSGVRSHDGGSESPRVRNRRARPSAGHHFFRRSFERGASLWRAALGRGGSTTRLALAALAVVATSRFAAAQPAPTPEEVQQAQIRWNEGKKYFDAGNYEAARVAFKQAYTVFPHAAFLQNLGEAELRSGRNVEAARHFTAFLRAS